jgi:hypothetical protein
MSTKTDVFKCSCGDHAWFALTRGYVTLVDPELAPVFACWKWHAVTTNRVAYATRSEHTFDGDKEICHKIYVHQIVLPLPSRLVVDHKDGNGLNNKKSNLRALSGRNNSHAQLKRSKCSSKYHGVSYRYGRWFAYVKVYGKQHSLGLHNTEEDAARAYNLGAAKYYGIHACLNKVDHGSEISACPSPHPCPTE